LIELGQLRVLVYGILIILLFLWIPRGVIPTLQGLFRRRRQL
jgi:ABC-type branched-subunit amino acid transport system permease subunit